MPNCRPRNLNWYQCLTYWVVNSTETFFYSLGFKVGSNPKKTILLCWSFVVLSALGFLRFHQEKNPLNLWVPPNSVFLRDTKWLMDKFQIAYRPQIVQIVADDILNPEILSGLLDLDRAVKTRKTHENISFADVCFTIPKVDKGLLKFFQRDHNSNNNNPNKTAGKDLSATVNAALYCSFVEMMEQECFQKSILDLWDFDPEIIRNLTRQDIVNAINTYDKNAIMSRFKNYEDLLSGIERNETGHIIRAKSLQNYWMVFVNFSAVDMDVTGNNAGTSDWTSKEGLEWESEFAKVVESYMQIPKNYSIYYTSSRSFADISNDAMFQDIGMLCIGVFVMVVYVQFVISKFNWLEARVALGCLGLLTVGMAFVTGCGLCSLFGVSYGPVHTSLPFLLMGLGVDDMFVIMACWDDLSDKQKKLPMAEKIGLMLKHGGVSITVTSVTDILAFIIGSSTILPSLQSYCIYAAAAVLMVFIFSVTFFTACFTLDQQRIEAKKNGIFIWYKHKNYKPNECSQKQLSNRMFSLVYSKVILTLPGSICVILIAVICLGFSIESAMKLEQRFDPNWFVPKDTPFAEYLKMRQLYYPTNGFEAGIYVGSVNYSYEFQNIKRLVDNLRDAPEAALDIVSWVEPFHDFVQVNFQTDIYEEVLSEERFNLYLSMFLFSPRNAVFQANFRFAENLECGVPAPEIIMSSIEFRFSQYSGPEEYLPIMHKVQDIAKSANLTTGDKFSTVWSKVFVTWVTDELIDIEVMRNLQLALACVMGCTILLIADVQTCFWIFICVLMTMINVCGFMQRWGLTIDLVSCIGLELAIGLCVDYATHIGHTFLTIKTGDRKSRALKTISTIGAAVVYGGLSTFIGVFMLSQSEAYTFQAFFKIFFLVIIFGLFHGVVFLPVIFSWIGPNPYYSGEVVVVQEEEEPVAHVYELEVMK